MTRSHTTTLIRAFPVAALIVLVAWIAWRATDMVGPGKHEMQVEREHNPRIVALSPALAITLKDLGLADRIVGRHGFDLALDQSIPVCGDQSGLDYEALIRVRPTHILTQWGTRELPTRLRELAAQNSWKVQDYQQLTLDDIYRSTVELGMEFAVSPQVKEGGSGNEDANVPKSSDALTDLTRRMRAAWLTEHPPLHSGRILLLESVDPPTTPGPGSFHQQVLERIGGTPAITTGNVYMTLDVEDVLRLAPDGIILLAPRRAGTPPAPAPSIDELRARLGRIGALDIPAVRRGHLALIDDPFCLTPSTALLGFSEQLERILKRWEP